MKSLYVKMRTEAFGVALKHVLFCIDTKFYSKI